MKGEWPLVGRAAELERVAEVLRRRSGGIVLAGPAGVGKTRLAVESLGLAEGQGFVGLRVAATRAAASLPFGAFAPLLPELAGGSDRIDVLRRVAEAVLARGGGRPVALLVDDVHLLDEQSGALIHQLAGAGGTFVLATVRVGEPTSDAVTALWKDGLADRLDVAPLNPEQVDGLVAVMVGGPVDGATARLIWERTEGNPLFVKELVIGAGEAGALRDDGGVWRLSGALPASDRLVELVEARLGGLGRAEREALELLAVWEPIGVEPFEVLSAPGCLTALESRRLVRVEPDGRRLTARFAHPLYGDVLRARLSPLRTRAVSGALAEAVEARGARRREDVLRVAAWRLDAGADVRGDLMLAGAADALGRQDFGLAERLARAAATAGAGFDAAFLAAQALHFQGRETDAEAELAALAGQAQDDAQRALVALTRMDICVYGQGRPEEALRIAEAVDAQLSERRWRHEIAVRRGGILNHTAGPSAAVEALAEVRRDAEGGAYIRACLLQSLVLIRMGRLTEGLEAAADAHAAHLTYTGPPLQWPPAFAAVLGTFAFLEGGPLQEAERRSVSGYGDAIAESSVTMQAWCGLLLARTRLARGRVQTAARQAREAVGLLRQVSAPVAGFALGCLAEALALSGRRQEAIAVVAELEGISVPSRHPMGLDLLRARAWVAASAPGDLSEARQLLERTAAVSEETGDLALRVGALHDLARLGRPKEVLGRLVSAAAGMEGELPAARAAHAGALTSADGPGLEQVSITFETLGADLLAAEAAADAAVAWRRAGDPRRAAAAGRRAHDLAARCEGARTPALTAITARAELTGRELEIARLAAAGVPNKEIAARLHLSLHTVQNKLHTAYEKLGVEGRAELAEALEGW